MTDAQVSTGAEHDAQRNSKTRAPEPTQPVEPTRDNAADAKDSPRAQLVADALTSYTEDKTAAAVRTNPGADSPVRAEDGFEIAGDVDVASNNEQSFRKGGRDINAGDQAKQPEVPAGADLKFVNYGHGTYAGAFLNVNAKPMKYEVHPGETLEQIARKHLGSKASADDVKKHMAEISMANPTVGEKGNEYVGKKGDVLRLPGHTADGAVIHKDSRGTRYTITPDGKTKVEYLDGTGFERTPDADGGVTKKYFGKKPEDNYTVKLDKDGKVVSNDRVDPNHKQASDLTTETKRLQDLADKNMGIKSEREAFKRNMQEFAERARKSGLPESEVAQTFAEVSRLFEAKGSGQPMTSRERTRLASGIMSGAAHPESNDQGDHNTCAMATVENRLYRREPSAVARTIADVATTGKFVAADGTVVRMDPQDLRAHGQGALNEARGTNVRTYASQIFQVTASNAFLTSENEKKIPPGEMRYAQVKPAGGDDTGERLIDNSTNPPKIDKTIGPGDAATPNGLVDTAYLLTGKQENDVLITNDTMAKISDVAGKHPKQTVVSSPEELIEVLKRLKAEGKPMSGILMVHSNSELFSKGTNNPLQKDEPEFSDFIQDLHYVNIVGFDEKTGMVQVDNQWGDDQDRINKPVSVYELFNSTKRPNGTEWLGRLDERWDRQDDLKNAKQLAFIMGANIYKWASEGDLNGLPVDQNDVRVTMQTYERMLARLSPANAREVKKAVDELMKAWQEERTKRGIQQN